MRKGLTITLGNLVVVCSTMFFSGGSVVQAAMILPGDLFISEVMANPGAVSDTMGEWLELFNRSSKNIDINGLILMDAGSDRHTIDGGGELIIAPGEYFVLGRNGDSAVNGGYVADYVYSGFTLGNTSDEIILSDGVMDLAALAYFSGSNFGVNGISVELSNLATFPLAQEDYLPTVDLSYGMGDFGSPGEPGNMPLSGVPQVPLPAAVWLFASGIIALVGISRRRKISAAACE